jgi:hypothetical protein
LSYEAPHYAVFSNQVGLKLNIIFLLIVFSALRFNAVLSVPPPVLRQSINFLLLSWIIQGSGGQFPSIMLWAPVRPLCAVRSEPKSGAK